MRQILTNWEGTLLLFVVITAVLTGIAYVLSINYALPIPWLIILLAALAASLGVRARRRSAQGPSGQ
jgi:hypothetical protein